MMHLLCHKNTDCEIRGCSPTYSKRVNKKDKNKNFKAWCFLYYIFSHFSPLCFIYWSIFYIYWKMQRSQLKTLYFYMFSSVQLLSHVWLFATPWIAACQASLSITNSRSSLKLTSIESVMPSSHLILCCPLLLLSQIPPSIRVFSKESTLRMRWPKYWSFSFSIIPSKEHLGLTSFRMDWLDLLAVQGILKSLLQHHTSQIKMYMCVWGCGCEYMLKWPIISAYTNVSYSFY